ncbi:hypothetical protein BRARA_G01367 [Brassica rapa]|uniref:Uncharacterized protein n=3 Tax=Brassica TaxID=3705 RepID=A0A397YVK3_BRACM|nr:hypothetical protein BRARA_G01367 [Brassica rapa]CAF2165129.1 unnamed protein product [Brassica napus]CAG7902425.1 unnamed protein product [Brassica rapa]VDC98576.1 unnamed protein product [Brassica rapa]
MDQEGDPCEAKKKASLEPKAPTADDPDLVSPSGSDPCLSEEELITTTERESRGTITLSDEEIIESIYQSLLQIILSVRLQQGSAEAWCLDDCKTPLSRVAKMVPDTCPGAPVQLAKKWRNNGSGRGRKLLF